MRTLVDALATMFAAWVVIAAVVALGVTSFAVIGSATYVIGIVALTSFVVALTVSAARA